MQRLNSFLTEHGYVIPSSQGEVLIPTTFDSPHNEYIAWYVNHGLPAVILYIALLVCLSIRFLFDKNRFMDKHAFPGIKPGSPEAERSRLKEDLRGAMICYAVQAFFSFSVCIVAPLFWVVTGILSAEQ